MAIQQFDAFGNYTGGYGLADPLETEEERRRRLAKEAGDTLVGKTEVETYADGSQTRKITQEIPAAQPLGQGIQVAGPMDPEVFNRMINAESGGQQFNRQGGVLTSPKGALGLGQVMPATAAQPGYGVPSIFDLAERRGIAVPSRDQAGAAQLLANPELNREFAQNYANAMNKQFGQQGGVAAYNAGPGRVQSNMAANAGQLNAQALPQETQGYLGRVLGGVRRGAEAVVNAIIPSAQAATPAAAGAVDPAEERRRAALAQRPPLPQRQPVAQAAPAPAQAAPAPVAEAVSPYSLAAGMPPSQGLRVPGMPVGQTAQPSTQAIDLYQQNQDNIDALMSMRSNQSLPQFIRDRASNRAYDLIIQEKTRNEAEATAQKMLAENDTRGIAKILSKQTFGDRFQVTLKSTFLRMMGANKAADEELANIGYGLKSEIGMNDKGERAEIEFNPDGSARGGMTSDGRKLSALEALEYVGGRKSFELPSVHGTPVVKEIIGPDGKPMQIGGLRMYDPRSRQAYVQVGNDRLPDVGWTSPGQAPGAVYTAAGAKAQGTAAGEGYTPAPLPQRPGQAGAPAGVPAGAPTVSGGVPAGAPTVSGGVPAGAPTQAQPPQVAGGPTIGAPVAIPPAAAPQGVAGVTGPAAQKARERQTEKQQERLDKYVTETLVPAASSAGEASTNIKEQLRLFDDPRSNALFGLYNRAQSGQGREWSIVRDIFAGKVSKTPEELSKDIAALGLKSDEISILAQYNNLNGPIVAATARAIGGAQLSDADRSAAEKLQVDLGRTPALGAYNIKTQQLFSYNLVQAKRDYAAQNQSAFSSAAQLDAAWSREQAKLIDAYRRVSEQRMQFIKVNSGGQPASISMVREAFRRYPPPQYDPNVGWRNLRDRDLNQILQGR